MSTNVPRIPGLPSRYQFRDYLARGPNGIVIEALDLERGRTAVALKLLRADGAHAEVARAMFRREVEALKGLAHDGVVRIIDWFQGEENLLGIELELIHGGATLATLLEEIRTGRASLPDLLWRARTALRLVDAVLEAHKRDVIHRDIKPGNVLWERHEDTLKLSDFGIAVVLSLTAREPGGTTLRSFYSRPWAAPEQLMQRAPEFASDVYSFSLVVAALFVGQEPGEDFEPAALETFFTPVVAELARAGVAREDVAALQEMLARALREEPKRRPSLTELRDVLLRLEGALVERPVAAFVLTDGAKRSLAAANFIAEAEILEDFEGELRVQLERHADGDCLKIFGRTLYAVLKAGRGADSGATELIAVGAGQPPGPTHARHRAKAERCPIRLRIGRGSSTALWDFVNAGERERTRGVTATLLERAELIIDLERERLAAFVVEGSVLDGTRVSGRREDRIGQAAGYEGSQTEKVEVDGGFRIALQRVTRARRSTLKNIVKATLEARGDAVEAASDEDWDADETWATLFDDLRDVDVLDEHEHLVGKVTGYDPDARILQVDANRKRRLHRQGTYIVRDHQKENQLRHQEAAIDCLARGETARPDMRVLLASAAAHEMGAKPWVELLQGGLMPEARVRDLVDRILASHSAFCLQGPPGTGKTTVIAEVVAQLLERDPRARVLVCSQANDAVANAIERIRKVREQLGREWLIVRDVRRERAQEEGPWAGFDAAYDEFSARVSASARGGVVELPADLGSREAVESWAHAVENKTRHAERDYRRLVQVWGTTTARAERPLREMGGAYDLVIIDEAAKATVGEVIQAIVHAKRLLLVGDQKQLPPFLEDTTVEALQELGISAEEAKYSLFEHLFALVPSAHRDMLDVQFRMHPTIGEVVSRLFYEGKLKHGPGTDRRPMPEGVFDRVHRVMWVDVLGRDYKAGKTSRANDEEVEVVLRLLDQLDADARNAQRVLSVAVIAPYAAQARALNARITEHVSAWKGLRIHAATVDAFQGREADVVLLSLVRTGSAEQKFVADGRRFNVALSRARSLLVLVGDQKGARSTEMLRRLLEMVPEDNQISAEALVPREAWIARQEARRRAMPPRPGRKQPKA